MSQPRKVLPRLPDGEVSRWRALVIIWFSSAYAKLTSLPSLPSRNLMAKDDFKNLGFREGSKQAAPSTSEPEQGVKGELRW